MATDQDLINALVACAQAELNLPLTPEQRAELIDTFNKKKDIGIDKRARATIDEFVVGKRRGVFDSVSSSDNADRKMKELEAILKDWKK